MVKITEGGDENYTSGRGAGRNPNIGRGGTPTGRGQGNLPKAEMPSYMTQRDWLGNNLQRMDNNSERLIRAVKKDLEKLPKKDRQKIERWIRNGAAKRGGPKRPPKRNRRGDDGGTPFIDSRR